jgi:LytS/YehU family sensor histidine kinase
MKAAYSVLHTCLLTGLATFVYVYRSRAIRRLAALRDTQLEHAKLGRGVLQSRLQVMQARVEPQFLFNTLAQVERLYETEPDLACRMLDDLIVYLRAALPLLRESTSTLAKEIELVRAYLGIMQIRLKERLGFAIDVPDAIKDARMPPMMLLPLIDHAIVHGLEPLKAGGTISIGTTVEAGKLRLTVADSGAGFVPGLGDEGIQQIRERVTALYGDAARLTLGQRGDTQGTEAIMEIPYERA